MESEDKGKGLNQDVGDTLGQAVAIPPPDVPNSELDR